MKEIFKTIEGYEDYQVSNLGRVKSLKHGKERILKAGLCKNSYLSVSFFKNKKQKTFMIHQLVAETFLGHVTCGMKFIVNHLNNISTDNRLENLEITTQRKNCRTHSKGESKYKGVSKHKPTKKWRAMIYINNKNKHLGLFANEYDAHLAYQTALSELNKKSLL